MEISYDLIIEYLVNNQDLQEKSTDFLNSSNKENIFSTPKNTFNYKINFPLKFQKIFSDKFYRYGITNYDNNNNNISFWSSLIILLDKLLIDNNSDELKQIDDLKNKLIKKFSIKNISYFLKEYNKNNIKELLNSNPNFSLLQYISDVLDFNIFIFDFKTQKIYSIYKDTSINIYKETILLAVFDNLWEPLISINIGTIQKIFTYNDIIIKNLIIIKNEIIYFDENNENKLFSFDEKVNNDTKKLNLTKLNRMKLNDLINLSKEYNLNIDNKIKKKDLIDLILKNENNNIYK
jgi:hypothetical protein